MLFVYIFFVELTLRKKETQGDDWREGSSKLNRQKKEEENYAAPRSRKETPRRNWDTSPDFPGFLKKKNKNTIFYFLPPFNIPGRVPSCIHNPGGGEGCHN